MYTPSRGKAGKCSCEPGTGVWQMKTRPQWCYFRLSQVWNTWMLLSSVICTILT